MKQCLGLVAFCAIVLFIPNLDYAASRNIFDDDWTPAKPATPPSKQTTENPPAEAPAKNPPPKIEIVVPPVAVKAVARRPIPAKAEQAASRKVLKEVFADQLADQSAAARRKLTAVLMEQADRSSDVPADQFVLLAAAVDAGLDASSLPQTFTAIDRMASTFEIDMLATKADAVGRFAPKSASPEIVAENVAAAIALTKELATADEYAAAARVCASLQPMTSEHPALRAQLQARQRELAAARDASEQAGRDAQTLKASPNDPAANLALGRYVCLIKGDWERGLPMLVVSSDPVLAAIAARELKPPPETQGQFELAGAWWDVAQKQSAAFRAGAENRAAFWYRQAMPALKGLSRTLAQKRVALTSAVSVANHGKTESSAANSIAHAPAGGMNVLLFSENGKGLPTFKAMSGGRVLVRRADTVAATLDDPAVSQCNVIVWEANSLCDAKGVIDQTVGDKLRRFVEGGGDVVLYEQFRPTNWEVIERTFGIKRLPGGPFEIGSIDPALAAKVHAAGISDEEIARIRFPIIVEMPAENSAVLIKSKKGATLAAVVSMGKGRFIYTAANGDADHAAFIRAFFDYLFATP